LVDQAYTEVYKITQTAKLRQGRAVVAAESVSRPMRRMFRELFGYIRGIRVDEALAQTVLEKGSTVADVHIYVTRPAEKEGAALEDVEEVLRELDYVSGVEASPAGNVVAVSFEGGKAEQAEITRTVEETGYKVSRLSVRTTFTDEEQLWDI
jgi:copper chaperone CopZ